MQSVPGSSMVMIEYQGYEPAIVNLKSTSRYSPHLIFNNPLLEYLVLIQLD